MARTKQPPMNPNIDRPVAAIGSNIQSTDKKADPQTYTGKSSEQGRQTTQEAPIQEVTALWCPTNWRNQKASP